MSRFVFRWLMFLSVFVAGTNIMSAEMNDAQVVEYVKSQKSVGKSDKQIYQELVARGVTRQQLERIKAGYDASGSSAATEDKKGKSVMSAGTDVSRMRTARTEQAANASRVTDASGVMDASRVMETGYFDFIIDESYMPEAQEKKPLIFGHDIFSNKELTFEPNQNLATPADYVLGPGDMVYIDIWGDSEENMSATISPEGSIIISQIGPVYLNGLTVNEADAYLRDLFAQKYAGFSDGTSNVSLTLGDVRSIMVNVMGEVNVPGTYRMSPFSSVFSALYNASGVTDAGSLRNVQLMRNGKKVVTIDLYDYIFNGRQSKNVRLQEGDVIIVPAIGNLVTVEGNVKRPMAYEMQPGETVNELMSYVGGFAGDAFTRQVVVSRISDEGNKVYNVDKSRFGTFTFSDGDVVSVNKNNDRYDNRVVISGAIRLPGSYGIDNNVNSVKSLVKTADGLLDDAFRNRALLYRERDDMSREVVSLDLAGILSGKVADVKLHRNDSIYIAVVNEIEDFGTMTISGQVNYPGEYQYAQSTTIEDLILMAGGLKQGASLARADVARRKIDPYSTLPSNEIAEIFSFSIKDGLVVDGIKDFMLEPYDIVEIRRSPGYEEQQLVQVNGEVAFVGQYALAKRGERISDIVKRCGGLTPSAYAKGASLMRRMSDDEAMAYKQAIKLATANQNSSDSIEMSMLNLEQTYPVGIDLEAALQNPGSYADVVLKEGDVLTVPETTTTVKISGDVLFPNVVTYIPGKNYKYYVDQAGGFGERARKNKAFVVYMNGQVARCKGSTPIEPGAQIIIPSKPQNGGTDWAKVMSITSGFGSLATMAATIYSIFK